MRVPGLSRSWPRADGHSHASAILWAHYVGLDSVVVARGSFGASAPTDVLFEKFGITAGKMVDEVVALLEP